MGADNSIVPARGSPGGTEPWGGGDVEARFRALTEAMPQIVCVLGPDGHAEYVNTYWTAYSGKDLEATRRAGFLELVHPDDLARARDTVRRALATCAPQEAEVRYRAADGTFRWFLCRLAPVLEGDRVVRLLGAGMDVEERRRAEDALRLREEQLGLALRASGAGSFELDLQTWDALWSPEMFELYGMPPAEEPVRCDAWSRRVHPDDQAVALAALERARETGELDCVLRVFRQDSGAMRWMHARGEAVPDAAGATRRVVGLNVDITERRTSEEALRAHERRYRKLFEGSLDAVYATREDGTILDANQAACAMHGMTVEEIRAAGRQGLVVPDEAVASLLERRAAEGQAKGFATMRRNDGSTFPAEIESVIVDPGGREFTSFVIARDITERRRVEEELRAADRAKTEFLGVLSHELRNPLAPIRNGLYLLEHAEAGGAHARGAMEVIRRQTDHLTRLIEDLLDLTRISRGKIALRRSRFDLREVVRRTADDLASVFAHAGVTLQVAEGDAPAWLDADATRVAQVLGNLLQNAVKFTPAGGRVSVTLAVAAPWAELRVRDTGVGIEPGAVARMFEPFVQGEQGLARTRGGLGLGLPLVRGLTELHGGSVEARSEGPGRGAEFLVRFPLGAAAQREISEPGRAPGGPRRVLVIEDNVDAGFTLAEVLALEGHEVRVARDGASGIALARELGPDVVLCDIGLPDLDGYEVARTLRRDDALKGARLVALTGYAQPDDQRRARDAGFDAHLGKPPDLERLFAVVGGRA